MRYWDLAATEKTAFNDPDWTVDIKLGRDKSSSFYLLDMVRVRATRVMSKNCCSIPPRSPRRRGHGETAERAHEMLCLALAGLTRILAKPDADTRAVRRARSTLIAAYTRAVDE